MTVYTIGEAIEFVETLPSVANEGDIAVDRNTLDVYQYAGGEWIKNTAVEDFDTITALYNARDSGNLTSDNLYRVAWSGDPYAPDGEFVTRFNGTDFDLHPFETALEFPSWLWGSEDWSTGDTRITSDGVLTIDENGRPELTSSSASSQVTAKLSGRYAVHKPRLTTIKFNYVLASTSGTERFGVRISDKDNDGNDAVAYHLRTSASQTDPILAVHEGGGGTSTFRTSFVSSDTHEGLISISPDVPFPNDDPTWAANYIFNPSPDYRTNTISGFHGDWRITLGYAYRPGLYLTATDPTTKITMRSIKMVGESS